MIETHSSGTLAEVAICQKIGAELQSEYPGYPWMVGVHEVRQGVAVIDLPPEFKPPSLRQFAYLLHLDSLDDGKTVKAAGGEWLERLRLARSRAMEWAAERARENGLDASGMIMRSKG